MSQNCLQFGKTHFSTPFLSRRFHARFMSHTVITSYFTDLNAFDHLSICDRSFKKMLELVGWESVLSIDEYVYPNLVKAFYSNIELSVTTQDMIVTNVGGVPVKGSNQTFRN